MSTHVEQPPGKKVFHSICHRVPHACVTHSMKYCPFFVPFLEPDLSFYLFGGRYWGGFVIRLFDHAFGT